MIEFARDVLHLEGANSTEFVADTPHPVICMLEEQKQVTHKGGTMRLGAQPCDIEPGSRAATAYGTHFVRERHRHRYEFHPDYKRDFEEAGFSVTGTNPDRNLPEIVEIPEHPWFVAVQFHPEFKSKPHEPHPLFASFVEAAINRHQSRLQVTV